MKTHLTILLTLAGLLPAYVSAQEPATTDTILSLEQCKLMAVANNAAILTADNELRQAIETRREAFTKYFPEVAAGGTAFWAHKDVLEYTVLDMFTIGLINNGRGAGVWAIQPVFAGGQIVNGNRLAKVGEEAARIKKEQSADNVMLNTEGLYWQLVTLEATRSTVTDAITTLDSLTAQVQADVDAGMVTRNDLLKAELKRNTYRTQLVDLDNGISLVKMLLAQQIGLAPDTRPVVEATVPDSMPAYPSSLHVDGSAALPLTADHRLLVKNVEARELERKMEVGRNLPQVGVGAGWFYHNVLDQNHNFGALMVTVNIPISGWWGGSHAIKRKTLAVDNARIELNDLSRKLEIEMADKWDNLTAAYRKMQIASEAITQSRENLRLNNLYYEAGLSTMTDLLDAQTMYSKSQADYIAAYGAYRLSRAQYLNATARPF